MFKMVLLVLISNMLIVSESFFISGKDIRKLFGFSPSFYEIYKKEASQNYKDDNHKKQYYQENKKYEDNINEKLNQDRYYYRKPEPEDFYEYNRDYSSKKEHVKPYKNEYNHKNCDSDRYKSYDADIRVQDSSKVQPQFKGKLQLDSERKLKGENTFKEESKDMKKDYISGILVALPDFISKEAVGDEYYLKNNNEKMYIRPFTSTTSPKSEEEYTPPENIYYP